MSERFSDLNLKPKEWLFIKAYLETGSVIQAAIACEYTGKMAEALGGTPDAVSRYCQKNLIHEAKQIPLGECIG
ncbi:hypothetical protein AAU61_14395 [Desulfocarbo indianensis]|nr:hypothetical protein AAU61_14395 [Desulfocarbo indianensis]